MADYTLQDAQNHLQKLIADALSGETILIHDSDKQAVQLVPVKLASKPRKAGSARGMISISSDFDMPIDDFNKYME